MRSRISRLILIISILSVCIPLDIAMSAQVGTYEWTGALSGSWNEAGNWTLIDGQDATHGTAEVPLGDGIPGNLGARSEMIIFHAAEAANLNTFLTQTRTIGALHFSSNASSTITIGGLQGNGVADDLTPVRLIIDSATPPADFYAVDILVPAGQHHVIQGAGQGSGTGNEELQFFGSQVWQIDEGASLEFNARVRQISNASTNYQKTGDGLLIFSQANSGSSSWQFTGSSNPVKTFTISDGTLRLAVNGARGNTANTFRIENGATLELGHDHIYGANTGAFELNGHGHNGVGALRLLGGNSFLNGTGGTFTLASDSSIGVETGGTFDIQHVIEGAGGLTKVGPGTLTLTGTNTYTGTTTVSHGVLNVNGSHTTGSNYVVGPTSAATLNVNGSVATSGNLDLGEGFATVFGSASLDVQDTINSAGQGTISVGANTTMISNNVRTEVFNVDGSVTVRANGGTAGASNVETLNMGVIGKLNLKNNDLVISNGTLSTVRDQIKLGLSGANDTAAVSGITSNMMTVGVHGFGYALGNDVNRSPLIGGPGAGGTLSGQTYDADSVLVKFTYRGDADLDGDSDLDDLGFWANSFTGDLGNPANPSTFWTQGDWDYDGDTDLDDLGFWSSTFTGDLGGGGLSVYAPNASEGAIAALAQMGITSIPEPGSVSLLASGIIGAGLYRRRRNAS
jgi:autotransporter-associated beta strand protein